MRRRCLATSRTRSRAIAGYAETIHRGGAVALGIGGDHSVTLAALRAAAAVHGPLGLVHLDAHHDVWDAYFGRPLNHGTVFRRACEEGLLDPARCIQAGMRGGLYDAEDYAASAALGLELVPWAELRTLEPAAFAARARARLGDGPAYLTFDVDLVDPAFCPGTGTPEVGGPSSAHALDLVRSLTGIDFRGFDVVEVAPQYDGPGQVTALLAATVCSRCSRSSRCAAVARKQDYARLKAAGKRPIHDAVRRMLSSVLAACLERRASPMLRRA